VGGRGVLAPCAPGRPASPTKPWRPGETFPAVLPTRRRAQSRSPSGSRPPPGLGPSGARAGPLGSAQGPGPTVSSSPPPPPRRRGGNGRLRLRGRHVAFVRPEMPRSPPGRLLAPAPPARLSPAVAPARGHPGDFWRTPSHSLSKVGVGLSGLPGSGVGVRGRVDRSCRGPMRADRHRARGFEDSSRPPDHRVRGFEDSSSPPDPDQGPSILKSSRTTTRTPATVLKPSRTITAPPRPGHDGQPHIPRPLKACG
jgi:hypothetical protein